VIGILRKTCYKRIPGLLLIAAAVLLWTSSGEAAYRVTGLEVTPAEESVTVTLEATASVSYSYFTMDEGEPRLVVDLFDAVHELPKYHFQTPGTPLIDRIRTSQYRPYPDPSARVVLDLPVLMPFQINAIDNQLIITLSGASVMESISQEPVQESAEEMSNPTDDVQSSAEKENIPPAEIGREEPAAAKKIADQSQPITPKEIKSKVETSAGQDIQAAHDSLHTEKGDSTGEKQEPPVFSQLFTMGLREPVSYSSGGRRDPFRELPVGQQVEFGHAPLADVEKLSIVGILWDEGGYRALAQDVERNAYVFRKGDPVLYGHVTRIEEERVIFRLYRRGLDRTIILKLPQ
jgi:hypothetical protein